LGIVAPPGSTSWYSDRDFDSDFDSNGGLSHVLSRGLKVFEAEQWTTDVSVGGQKGASMRVCILLTASMDYRYAGEFAGQCCTSGEFVDNLQDDILKTISI